MRRALAIVGALALAGALSFPAAAKESYGIAGFNLPVGLTPFGRPCYSEDDQVNASTDGVLDAGQSTTSTVYLCLPPQSADDTDPNHVGPGGTGLKWVLRNAPPDVEMYAIRPDGTVQHPYAVGQSAYGTEWRSCAMATASISSGTSGNIPTTNFIQGGVWTFVVVNHGAAMKLDGNYRNNLWFGLWLGGSYAPFQNTWEPICPVQDQRLVP